VVLAAEPFSAEGLWGFAQSLAQEGDYYRAVTEYKRLIYLHPEHPLAEKAAKEIGFSLLKAERWDDAATYFEQLADKKPGARLGEWAALQHANLLFQRGKYELALARYESFAEAYETSADRDEALYGIAWCHLMLGQYAEAKEAFLRVPEGSQRSKSAEELAGASQEGMRLRRRSPTLAGIMAACVPGLGHLYAGRPRDAGASFLLNGAFAAATASAFHAGADVAGVVAGIFGLHWYSGNIFGALNFTHRFNKQQKDEFLNKLQKQYGAPAAEMKAGE